MPSGTEPDTTTLKFFIVALATDELAAGSVNVPSSNVLLNLL